VGTIVSNPGIAQGRPSAGRFAGRWAQGKLKTETGPLIRGWKAVTIGAVEANWLWRPRRRKAAAVARSLWLAIAQDAVNAAVMRVESSLVASGD
jgi:hypothetical protein